MEINVLTGVSTEIVLSCFNESFSDYMVPLQLTEEQLVSKIRSDRIDFAYSVGAFKKDKLVGFILHGMDNRSEGAVLYNAGTGVIPRERQQGLTRRMYDHILPLLNERQVKKILLEVIATNIPALKTYEGIGFHRKRELICYRGTLKTSNDRSVLIREMRDPDWKILQQFWDFYPTWQNDVTAVKALMGTNKFFGAFIDDRVVGYVVYNPITSRVQQFGVDKRYRNQKIATSLFSKIREQSENISIINIEADSVASNKFLEKIGLEKFAEQIEMGLGFGGI